MGKTIFDPKFVHFMWDDSLKGKEGFAADNIKALQRSVEENNTDWRCMVNGFGSDGYPFATTIASSEFKFFYYDPLYIFKMAWKKGRVVQYMTTINVKNGWADVTEDWAWDINHDTQYRIKPEKDLRPFKDMQELKNAWSDKAGMIADYEEPMIWVRWKDGNEHRLINAYNYGGGREIKICGDWVSLRQLFEQYEFIDGTPCGVEFDL